jgi:hypothetical protein
VKDNMWNTKVSVSIVAVVLVGAVAGFWLLTYQRFQAAVVTEIGEEGGSTQAGTGTGGGQTSGGATVTCTAIPDGEALPEECETGGNGTGGNTGGTTGGTTGGSSGSNSSGNTTNGNTGGSTTGSSNGSTSGSSGSGTGQTSGSTSETTPTTGQSATGSSDLPDSSTNSTSSNSNESPASNTETLASPFGSLFSSANSGFWWVVFLPLVLLDLLILLLVADVRRRVKKLEHKDSAGSTEEVTQEPSPVSVEPVQQPVAPTIAEQPVELTQPVATPMPEPVPTTSVPLEMPPQIGGVAVVPPADQSTPQPPTGQ